MAGLTLSVDLGLIRFDLEIGKRPDQPQADEPPFIDTKYAAHLGNPTGFGLLIRPDHIEGE